MEMRSLIRTILSYIWPFSKFISRLDYLYSEVTWLRDYYKKSREGETTRCINQSKRFQI